MIKFRSATILLFICQSIVSYAQDSLSLTSVLKERDDYNFIYKSDVTDTVLIDLGFFGTGFDIRKLESLINRSGLKVYVLDDSNVFIYPNKLEFEKSNNIVKKYDRSDLKNVRIGNPSNYNEGSVSQLELQVTDENNDPLPGVNVFLDDRLIGSTDLSGLFQNDVAAGNYLLKLTFQGLETEERVITLYSSGVLKIPMFSQSTLLDEVTVESNYYGESGSITSIGVDKIGIDKLEKLPSFAGNLDVIKSVNSLPGVTVSGESSAFLNVRGGRNDQTTVLMNNATVYNPGHLLGFFSVFNGDFVSSLTLFKGNIPAKYGMRSSSVLDVKMNNWGRKKWNIYGGLGIANSNLGIKSKLLKERLDIHLGGRISYVGWLLDLVPDREILRSTAQFGDLNFNARFSLDENDKFYFSSYYGEDYFNYDKRIVYRWINRNSVFRWTHAFEDKWFLDSELIYSGLDNSSERLEINDEFLFENGISDFSFKTSVGNEFLEIGTDITRYEVRSGEISPTTDNSTIRREELDNETLLNIGFHVGALLNVTKQLEFNPELRINRFINYGGDLFTSYESGLPIQAQNIVETRETGSNPVYTKNALEPRVGISYRLKSGRLKAGYARINQFLHLISNTLLVNPVTVWKGTDQYVPLTKIDQFSLGYEHTLDDEKEIQVSVDGFYKDMQDLIDYRDGAVFIMNGALEQEILRGRGTAYGVEFLMSKDKGLVTGVASYTFSRAFIKVNDDLNNIEINEGERYPYYSDRPHNIKASLDFNLSKKWTVSSNFTYISGSPITSPVAVYEIEEKIVPLFGDRNDERIPDYHRLDIVVTVKSRIRKTKKNNDRWVLTLYNVYGRNNIANIYFSDQKNRPAQPFALVNVDRIIPTLTYKFDF